MPERLKGCGTALVTPFTKDGAVDEEALRALIDWQIAEGIDFLVPCGSTGEAVTMTPAEHRRVVEITVEQVKGRVPVCAGAGSNDTAKAIALSKEMKAAGATHLLHVSPMYNKPPQRGIVAHFERIADATDLPIVVYNVPGRTGSNIEPKTTLALAKVRNIVAVKEASGNLGQIADILRERPEGFAVLSGDEAVEARRDIDGGPESFVVHGWSVLVACNVPMRRRMLDVGATDRWLRRLLDGDDGRSFSTPTSGEAHPLAGRLLEGAS